MLNKLKKNSKLWIIIIGAIAGVLLLMIGGGENKESAPTESDQAALERYSDEVEKKIHEICSKVKGVSDVSVAVSFESHSNAAPMPVTVESAPNPPAGWMQGAILLSPKRGVSVTPKSTQAVPVASIS